jgi:broad specificity phosphatase PhoE
MHFVRHGQSYFNLGMERVGRDPNIADAALTSLGLAQAEIAAQQLMGRGIRRVIASPYTRALQTALVIAEHLNVALIVEPLAGGALFV